MKQHHVPTTIICECLTPFIGMRNLDYVNITKHYFNKMWPSNEKVPFPKKNLPHPLAIYLIRPLLWYVEAGHDMPYIISRFPVGPHLPLPCHLFFNQIVLYGTFSLGACRIFCPFLTSHTAFSICASGHIFFCLPYKV